MAYWELMVIRVGVEEGINSQSCVDATVAFHQFTKDGHTGRGSKWVQPFKVSSGPAIALKLFLWYVIL